MDKGNGRKLARRQQLSTKPVMSIPANRKRLKRRYDESPAPVRDYLVRSYSHAAVLAAAVVLAAACSESRSPSGDSWSQAEKENAAHFVNALEYALGSISISNQGGLLLSETDRLEILRLQRLAVEEAALVKDSVLAKIRPELPAHFRNEFEEGLRLQIANLEKGDMASEIEGSALMDRWADWYMLVQADLRVPRP